MDPVPRLPEPVQAALGTRLRSRRRSRTGCGARVERTPAPLSGERIQGDAAARDPSGARDRDAEQDLPRAGRPRRGQPRGPTGPGPRSGGSERVGQVDADQGARGLLPAGPGLEDPAARSRARPGSQPGPQGARDAPGPRARRIAQQRVEPRARARFPHVAIGSGEVASGGGERSGAAPRVRSRLRSTPPGVVADPGRAGDPRARSRSAGLGRRRRPARAGRADGLAHPGRGGAALLRRAQGHGARRRRHLRLAHPRRGVRGRGPRDRLARRTRGRLPAGGRARSRRPHRPDRRSGHRGLLRDASSCRGRGPDGGVPPLGGRGRAPGLRGPSRGGRGLRRARRLRTGGARSAAVRLEAPCRGRGPRRGIGARTPAQGRHQVGTGAGARRSQALRSHRSGVVEPELDPREASRRSSGPDACRGAWRTTRSVTGSRSWGSGRRTLPAASRP